MKFYGRETKLKTLATLYGQMKESARMVVVTGRRRVGKTLLSFEFMKDKPHLYFFVAKKSEILLCQEFVRQIRDQLQIPVIGEFNNFKSIFQLLLESYKDRPLLLVIDEFQEFRHINPSVFSDIQNLWDQYKAKSQVMVLMMGSAYSMMQKIFQDSNEPLFGRADRVLHLKPFSIQTLRTVLQDNQCQDPLILFNYYMFTGGLPKYVDLLVTNKAYSFDEIVNFMISSDSPFLHEGKNLLIEEFGKEYATYFSILELIAAGKTGRSEIESIVESNVGGYLDRLENTYNIVERIRPISAKPQGRTVKYRIKDLFLCFWFRFIYRHRTALEVENYTYIRNAVYRNIEVYRGAVLERFFHQLFAATGEYNKIGNYWEKGNINEIDLVAINEFDKKMVIAEIKWNKNKISIEKLQNKATKLIECYPGYSVDFCALSLEDAFQSELFHGDRGCGPGFSR